MEGISSVKCRVFLDAKSEIEPPTHLLSTASLTDSGSSLLLVSGSRKLRAQLKSMRPPHIKGEIETSFLANALRDGARMVLILLIKEDKPTAVCLEQRHAKVLY